MQYSADELLFALGSMGIQVRQTNIPTFRLARKLSLALAHSQRIPELLKRRSDDLVDRSQSTDATNGAADEDDEDEQPVRGKIDPEKLAPWSSISKAPLIKASSHTNMSEALMRFQARKLSVAMKDMGLPAPDAHDGDPFPLFTNEFMDLRQSVLAIALRYDLGITVGMLEDEAKMSRIVFRIHEVHALTPNEPLYIVSYAPQTGPISPGMCLFLQKSAPPSSLLALAYGKANVDSESMSRIVATLQEQKLWLNILGENQRRLVEEYVEKFAPKPYVRSGDSSTEGSGTTTPSVQPDPPKSTKSSNRKKSKKKIASSATPSSSIPSTATIEEIESRLNFKLSFFLPPGPLSQEDIGELTRPGCELCGKKAKNTCGGCSAVRYCSKECQKSHWQMHKHLCKALSSGTWVTLRFMLFHQNDGLQRLSVNRFSTANDFRKKESENGVTNGATNGTNGHVDTSDSEPKPPQNTHGDKPFLIKIQRSMGGSMPMLVYDRKREFEVNVAKEGMPTMAEMMDAAKSGGPAGLDAALSGVPKKIADRPTDGPGKADAEAYAALDLEVQRTGYMGMKAFRWAKRVSDWEVSVCLDRGPGVDEIQW